MGNNAGNCYDDGSNDNFSEIQGNMYARRDPQVYKRSVIPQEQENQMEGKMDTQTLRSGRIVTGINRKNKIIEGEIRYPNGDLYNGSILEGMANGKGKMIYSAGGEYDGYFMRDKKEGKGTWLMNTGNTYTGGFKNDQFDGNGKVNYQSGDIFEGKFTSLYF